MPRLGLIGHPLSHSFSPDYFQKKFTSEGIKGYQYDLFPMADLSGLQALITRHTDLIGLNVTIPYKSAVIPLLNELDTEASKVGAVNTIKILRDGEKTQLKGYNTDIIGFKESLPTLEWEKKALILGSGGAAKAVSYALQKEGIAYILVSRGTQKNSINYSDIDEKLLQGCQLIINTTPLGTWPEVEQAPDIPYQLLLPSHFLYDLVYNPAETTFLKKGADMGANTKNGLEMLERQAEASWKIWNS